MKKRIFTIISALMLILCINVNSTSAAIGDVIGQTTYTDIRAYINHFAIQSYNVNGYTVVVAEDLINFGFSVVWNQEDRSLRITRNKDVNEINQWSVPSVTSPNLLGRPAFNIIETDIKTYINDVEVPSYNIDGKTVVDFSCLSAFGPVNYDQTYRVIKLWVEDGLEMNSTEQAFTPLPKYTLYSPSGDTISVYEYQINDYLKVGWYSSKQEAQAIQKAADEAKKIEKNKAVVNRFYKGQQVSQWVFLYTRYGVVQDVDYSNGKVLVYWNRAKDGHGEEMDYLSGSIIASLYTEEWIDASDLLR